MANKYVGTGQAAVMMTIFGIFYCLSRGQYTDMGLMLVNAVMSVIWLAVLILPLVILMSKSQGSVTEILSERLGIVGKILSVLYFAFFISAAADFLRSYSTFVNEKYFHEGSIFACIILLGLVCIYISHTGVQTVCRMSTVLIFMLAFTTILFAVIGFDDIFAFDFSSVTAPKIELGSDTFSGLFPVGAAAAAALCVMCGGLQKKTRCGGYLGLLGIFAAVVIITFAVCAVLGDYISISEYPMSDAVIYISRNISIRTDGVFFVLWTIIAAAVISLLCSCGANSVRSIFPKIKGEGMIAAAIAVIAALCSEWTNSEICTSIYKSLWSPVIIVGIIPLVLIFINPKKKAGEARK